jgi:hypothetical protein
MSKLLHVGKLPKSSQDSSNKAHKSRIKLNTLIAGREGIVVGKTFTVTSVGDVIDCDDFCSQEDRTNNIKMGEDPGER